MLFSKKTNGYLTLEAAFLVPLAFFLFVFLLHLSFFMAGRTYLAQDAYLLAFRASLLKGEEEVSAFVASGLGTQTNGKYTGNEVPQAETQLEGNRVVVNLRTLTNRSAFDLAGNSPWEAETRAEALKIDVTGRIRKIDRMADLAYLAWEASKQAGGN